MGDFVATIKDLGYEAGIEKVTLPIHGMSCASCVKKVEDALNSLEGVVRASVNFATEQATVQYIPGAVSLADFRKAVKDVVEFRRVFICGINSFQIHGESSTTIAVAPCLALHERLINNCEHGTFR